MKIKTSKGCLVTVVFTNFKTKFPKNYIFLLKTPFFSAIGVLSVAVAYGVYMFKNKGKMSTSVYLMHLRVGAQGAAVASLTAGLIYTMINDRILKKKS